MSDVDRWLRHLVSLGTSVEVPAPDRPDLASCWDAVVAAARAGRISGTLVAVAGAHTDELAPERLAEARDLHRSMMTVALALERTLLVAHDVLDAVGIPHLVLKGPAVAHLDHADPAERDFGDVDLLVPSLAEAVPVLERAGFDRPLPAARPGLDDLLSKSVTLRLDRRELDLHRTLAGGVLGRSSPTRRLWQGTEAFAVGDTTLRALARPLRLVHTAVHLRLGGRSPRLSTHRDLLVQMDRTDVDVAVATAEDLELAAVLHAAVDQLAAAGWPAPEPYRAWAAAHTPPPDDAARVRAHIAADDDFAALALSVLPTLGWRDRVRVARALVVPAPQHLAARGLRRSQHLRRITSPRRWRSSRSW